MSLPSLPEPFDPLPRHCERCRADLYKTGSTMSVFDTATICFACKEDERQAPGFAAAREAEERACRGGNYNFPGVGLSADDHAFLAARRQQREVTHG